MAQLVRAPPCHGGGHGFESRLGRFFEKRNSDNFISWCGGIGRRKGLKIPRWQHRTGSSPVTSSLESYICRVLFLYILK